jgi:hypothetical protein
MNLSEPIAIIVELSAVFEELGLRYLVGGSIASSFHGIPRSTNDIDLVVALPGRVVDQLVAKLEDRFYVDRDMIIDAIKRQASFNIIHQPTMYKVDVFIADRSELTAEEFERREALEIGEPPRAVWVCSAEDIVVQKLDWFQKGNQISERQWSDLLGVMNVQGQKLDIEYLRRWAVALGLSELLERALRESDLVP